MKPVTRTPLHQAVDYRPPFVRFFEQSFSFC
jgi:hypothetical protein